MTHLSVLTSRTGLPQNIEVKLISNDYKNWSLESCYNLNKIIETLQAIKILLHFKNKNTSGISPRANDFYEMNSLELKSIIVCKNNYNN